MAMLSTSQQAGDEARAELADLIDLQMSPLGLSVMDSLDLAGGQTVLDVGCGAGETILQLLDRVGPTSHVIGMDIGPRTLAVARARTAHLPQVTLLQEDASNSALPDQSIDSIFSRFGVMFFADPIGAFTNMRRMLKRGGRIGFVCWRSMQENELDFAPVDAAALAVKIDDAPFSFDSAHTIKQILRSAGFGHIIIEARDTDVSCGSTEAMVKVVTRVGALGAILRDAPALLSQAEPKVRAAMAARELDGKVSLRAATWIVTAIAA